MSRELGAGPFTHWDQLSGRARLRRTTRILVFVLLLAGAAAGCWAGLSL